MSAIPDPRSLPILRPGREKKRVKRVRKHDEDDLQAEIVALFEDRAAGGAICGHIANGGFRSWKTARAMKRAGVKKGLPDLLFMNILGLVFWMEVKTRTGSLSKEQRDFKSEAKRS